jgi:hypothetical protein
VAHSGRRWWLANVAALLALLLGGPAAFGQGAVTVTASATQLAPNPILVGGTATSSLSATVTPPTICNYTCQLQGPSWYWTLGDVAFSPINCVPGPAPAGAYSASIDQPDPSSPDATLTLSVQQAGTWYITATVSASYTDLPCSDTWSGSDTVMLAVTVVSPSPTVALTSASPTVCAGGQNTPEHQTVLTATATDGQGGVLPGQLVLFTTSDGSVSPSSGTTDSNGVVTTTLTSSQTASEGSTQWFATVTATLASDATAYASTQVEFQPPAVSLTLSPDILADGDTATLPLALSWNGQAVQGHTIEWRITRVWDENQQLIYDDTGTPPSGYVSFIGQQALASPTDAQGQAQQQAQAMGKAGRVEIGARDKSVKGAQSQKAPEQRQQIALKGKVLLKSLEFTSDHAKICDGGDVKTAGSRFPKPEWDTKGTNAPITHTAGEDKKVSLKLTLTVDAAVPDNTPYTLTGTSAEDGLTFTADGKLSSGTVVIPVTATKALGKRVRKIEQKITWSITLNGNTIPLGDTGPHKIYTTVGTPDDSGPDQSTVPNVPRMEIVVDKVSAAIAAADGQGYKSYYAGVVWELNKANGAYFLGRSLYARPKLSKKSAVEPWYLPSVSTPAGGKDYDGMEKAGADCISIAVFLKNVCMVTGISGGFDSKTYMAYYATAAGPNRPKTALVGSLSNPYINPGDKGAPLLKGTQKTWILGLADRSCKKVPDDGTLPGRVGCGPNGLNNFEAAVLYTDQAGMVWYYPGGTQHCYNNKDKVVQIFRTMVWSDGDPLKVQAVDFIYNAADGDPDDDKP